MNSDKAKTHILVVDDEELVAGSIERTLRTFDLSVTVATSGVEALNIARRHKPDIMALDVLMPGMDGLEVCREVRADPILYDLPIIFLTARAKMEDKNSSVFGRARTIILPNHLMPKNWCCVFMLFCGAALASPCWKG